MRESKPCPYLGWRQMPTEELDQILQAELEKEHPNEEVVLPILHELKEREKDIPVEKTPEVLAILNKLSKHETSSKQSKHKRRWLVAIAAAAAIVFFVIMSVPTTAQAESLFDIFHPFVPPLATPSMILLRKNRNSIIRGREMTTTAAIIAGIFSLPKPFSRIS